MVGHSSVSRARVWTALLAQKSICLPKAAKNFALQVDASAKRRLPHLSPTLSAFYKSFTNHTEVLAIQQLR